MDGTYKLPFFSKALSSYRKPEYSMKTESPFLGLSVPLPSLMTSLCTPILDVLGFVACLRGCRFFRGREVGGGAMIMAVSSDCWLSRSRFFLLGCVKQGSQAQVHVW